jgi:hypothetical protein
VGGVYAGGRGTELLIHVVDNVAAVTLGGDDVPIPVLDATPGPAKVYQ